MQTGTNFDNPCVYRIYDYDSTLESMAIALIPLLGIDPTPGPRSGYEGPVRFPCPEITPRLRGYDAKKDR